MRGNLPDRQREMRILQRRKQWNSRSAQSLKCWAVKSQSVRKAGSRRIARASAQRWLWALKSAIMNSEEQVKSKWPDAEISSAFAVQRDKSRRWMYCVMSSLKFRKSRGNGRVQNVGTWKFSEEEAWNDAARGL